MSKTAEREQERYWSERVAEVTAERDAAIERLADSHHAACWRNGCELHASRAAALAEVERLKAENDRLRVDLALLGAKEPPR